MGFAAGQQDGDRRPLASASAWLFLFALRASGRQPVFASPFSAGRRAVSFDMRGLDHLRVRRSPVVSQFAEQIFPDAASCPAREAIVDRRSGP